MGEKAASVDGDKALLSIDKLHTNLSITSIALQGPVISSLSVAGPTVRLVREGEQRFNITDLIEDLMKRSDDGNKSMFSISKIIVEEGRFEFADRFKKSQQEISEIRIGVLFIANFENDEETWVEPYFSAKVNGASLALNGKARPFTKNREATLELKLNDVDLTRIEEYSPIPVGISLLSGRFDSDLLLTFTQVDGESPRMVLTDTTALRKLEVENQTVEVPYVAKFDRLDIKLTEINLNDQKASHAGLVLADAVVVRKSELEPVLSLQKLSMEEVAVDSRQQSAVMGTVTPARSNASMRREADGLLDLVKLFAPLPGKPAAGAVKAEPAKPWTVQLGNLKLAGAALHFEESTLTKVVPMVVDPLDLTINDIDLNGATPLKLALKASINQKGNLETKGSLAWATDG